MSNALQMFFLHAPRRGNEMQMFNFYIRRLCTQEYEEYDCSQQDILTHAHRDLVVKTL